MADWSVLPHDILSVIALKLNSIEDFIYFSSVCTSWNRVSSMVKPPEWSLRADKPTPPWLLLAEPEPEPEPKHENSSHRKMFSISKNKCYDMMLPEIVGKRCWGSSNGWIVMHDFNKNVKLYNPITKAQLSLPSLYHLPSYSEIYVPQVGYGWLDDEPEDEPDNESEHESDDESDDADGSLDNEMVVRYRSYRWDMKVLVTKFIVLKIPGSNNTNELVVFVIHYPIDSISYARPGDKAWTEVVEPWPRNPHRPFIHHAMVWDGKVVILCSHIDDSIDSDAGIAYYDIASILAPSSSNNPVVKQAKHYISIPHNLYGEASMRDIATEGEMYMVELAGDLLIVLRRRESSHEFDSQGEHVCLRDYQHCYRTIYFKVYKHVRDTPSSSWERVEDLGNYLLFVGDNYATALHISKAPNCQTNAIYFIDDESRVHWAAPSGTRGHDMGMFDMTSGKITSFYDGGDIISKYFAPIWFMPSF